MKEVTTKLYSFSELGEDAKERARNNRREGNDLSYMYDEAHETVKKFHDVFGTREGSRSWLDVYTGNISDAVVDLEGERLQRYIWNNFGRYLWKGRYHTVKTDNHIIHHKRVSSQTFKNGNIMNSYYSAVFIDDNCCVLTGVCYDNDLLGPIYKFMDSREPRGNFQDLLEDCFYSLKKSLEDEEECRNSDEGIDEDLDDGEEIYTESGDRF